MRESGKENCWGNPCRAWPKKSFSKHIVGFLKQSIHSFSPAFCSKELEINPIGKVEKNTRDRCGRAAGRYHISSECSLLWLSYTTVLWGTKPQVDRSSFYTHKIFALTQKTSLFLPPRSIKSPAPRLEPQIQLLLWFHASAGQEIC